jgi:hypothetical protein
VDILELGAQMAASKQGNPMRRNKYGAIKTMVDGVVFDSKAEAARYGVLKALQKGNLISGLELQPKYRIEFGGVKICDFIPDFRYHDNRTGEIVVEDVKSPSTAKNRAYRIKVKLLKAFYGIDITEIM